MALNLELYNKIESYLRRNYVSEALSPESKIPDALFPEERESFGEAHGDLASSAPAPQVEAEKKITSVSPLREVTRARKAAFPGKSEKRKESEKRCQSDSLVRSTAFPVERSLDDVVAQVEESFSPMLFRLIREKDLEEVDIYKKAGIDRKLFSKIRCRDDYAPRKGTVLSLALAMELSLDETLDLLARAGFTLSRSSRSDLIVEYMISEGRFDMFEVNEALYAFGLSSLN